MMMMMMTRRILIIIIIIIPHHFPAAIREQQYDSCTGCIKVKLTVNKKVSEVKGITRNRCSNDLPLVPILGRAYVSPVCRLHSRRASFKKFSLGDIIWLTLSCAGMIDWKKDKIISLIIKLLVQCWNFWGYDGREIWTKVLSFPSDYEIWTAERSAT